MFLITFLFLATFSSVSGQGKNFFIVRQPPSWIVNKEFHGTRPLKETIDDGYFLALYENQNHIELQEEYTHLIREIVSDAGVQNASQISITYDPGFQKLTFHKIIVWRNGKPSDQLNASRFKVLQNEKDLSKFIYSGTYEAFFLLDDVRKGDRIEYSYTLKGDNPIYGKKYATQLYFESSGSVGEMYTNVIFNKNRSFQIKNFNFNDHPQKTEVGDLMRYEWESKQTKTHRITDFEPQWYNPLKRTQLTEYKTWNEVVNWGLNINDYPDLKSPLLDKKVEELKAQAKGDANKYLSLATRFVQDEIRYMGIEVGQYSHKPNSPEKVLKQRYGDCKDKSLLLTYLLGRMNINAYVAYVSTYETIKTKDYLPSPFVFNHVIVVVEHNNVKTWVDPTISFQRGDFKQIYVPDYGYALIIKKGVNALEKVISNPIGKQVSNLIFNLPDTAADKKATFVVKTKYSGQYADNMRSELAESGTESLEKSYLEYYTKSYPDIELAAPLQVKDNEEKNILEVVESYEIINIWEADEKNGNPYVYFFADLIRTDLNKITAKNRTTPMALKYPANIEQTITIHTPEVMNIDISPFKIDNQEFYFDQYGSYKEKTMTLNYLLRSKKSFIEGSQVKDYALARQQVMDNLGYSIYWPTSNNPNGIFNPYAVCLSIVLFIVFGIYCINLYQKVTPFDVEEIDQSKSIGGWLYLLGLFVLLNPLGVLTRSGTSGIWKISSWNQLSTGSTITEYLGKTAILADVFLTSTLFCFGILGIFLFFNRRKTFPKYYINYLFGYICLLVLNFVVFLILMHINEEQVTMQDYSKIGLTIVYGAIWISYLKRSERVQETFVLAYPEVEWTKALITHKRKNQKQQENIEHENI